MAGLAGFERLIESLVERSLIAPMRGRVQPVEIAKRLERAMRDGVLLGVDGQLAPNAFLVRLNPDDYAPLGGAHSLLEGELARYLAQAAGQQGYAFLAAPSVQLQPDRSVRRRSIQVSAEIRETGRPSISTPTREEPGRAATAGLNGSRVRATNPDQGTSAEWTLDFGTWSAPLPPGTVRIGRALDCDVVVPSPRVSRHHAELTLTADGYRVRDLKSTNGTTVDGHRIDEGLLRSGSRIAFGGVEGTLRHLGSGAPRVDAARA